MPDRVLVDAYTLGVLGARLAAVSSALDATSLFAPSEGFGVPELDRAIDAALRRLVDHRASLRANLVEAVRLVELARQRYEAADSAVRAAAAAGRVGE